MSNNAKPAPENATQPVAHKGLASACRQLGITAAVFKDAVKGLDEQDKADLAAGSYDVDNARRDAARRRATAGQYARRGACNLMGIDFA